MLTGKANKPPGSSTRGPNGRFGRKLKRPSLDVARSNRLKPPPPPPPDPEPDPDTGLLPIELRSGPALAVLALTRHQCSWPVGDTKGDDFYFCSAPRHPDARPPYCPEHAKKAGSTSPPRVNLTRAPR